MTRNYSTKLPATDELRRCYCEDGMSAAAIAVRYGVQKGTVLRRLRRDDIEPRPVGRGLANRGVLAPDRDELQRMVHSEHRSYEEIGAMFGVTRGAVMHWLKAHGIERPKVWKTRKKGIVPADLDEPTLRRLYESGLSTDRIGRLHGWSGTTVLELCERYGIERRPDGWDFRRIACTDGHSVRSAIEHQVCEWLTDHEVAHVYEPSLPEPVFSADFLANGWYIEVWGVVENPGYNERRRRKEAIYKTHSLPLISLEACHFRRASTIDKRLRVCLDPVISPLGF